MLYWVDSSILLIHAGIVSASGIAVFVYANSLEQELQDIDKKREEYMAEALHWKSQAQMAITMLDRS